MSRGGKRPGAGRKPAWNHGQTTVIRVPKVFSDRLLEIARSMDEGELVEFVTKSKNPTVPSSEQKSSSMHSPTAQIDFEFVTKPEVAGDVPLEADGGQWITSKQAYVLAQQRGCDRSLEGFRKWSRRNPKQCEQVFRLRRLTQSKSNISPSFEDLDFKAF